MQSVVRLTYKGPSYRLNGSSTIKRGLRLDPWNCCHRKSCWSNSIERSLYWKY